MAYTLLLLLILLVTVVILWTQVSGLIGFLRTGVPVVMSDIPELATVIGELGLVGSDVALDLGSGSGSVALLLERSGAGTVRGYEVVGWVRALARLRALFSGSRVRFSGSNFFSVPWQDATFYYAYLYPRIMPNVEAKFLKEAKPGARLLIRDFPLPTAVPAKIWHRGAPNPRDAKLTPLRRAVLLLQFSTGLRSPSHEYYLYVR